MNMINKSVDYEYMEIKDYITKKRKINFKKIIILSISTIVLSFILSFCMLNKSMGNLEGKWVRQPDDNLTANGMVIEIKKDGGGYVGEVIAINDETWMNVGTVKWVGFQKDALSVFAYYDMAMSADVTERTYETAYGLVSLSGKKITLYNSWASMGANQVWIKE